MNAIRKCVYSMLFGRPIEIDDLGGVEHGSYQAPAPGMMLFALPFLADQLVLVDAVTQLLGDVDRYFFIFV